MKKAICILSLVAVFQLFAEPSAFKAGDLDSPNPYGLTSSEKKIVEQNKNIQNISTKLFDTAQSQQELRNEIDGIKSLVVGHSEKIRSFEQRFDSDDNGSLKTLSKKLDDNLKLQNENYDKIMSTLSALAALLDETRDEYVSKEQLKAIVGKNYKELNPKQPKQTQKDLDKKSEESGKAALVSKPDEGQKDDKKEGVVNLEDMFKKAQQLFRDNKLKEAKAGFESVKKESPEYKRALLEYYLGEIEYKSGNYKSALEFYQASIEADEKAPYVPIILFHTGISLEKLGDKEAAKKILNSLIANYPSHYLVAPAKKRVSEIK